AERGRRVEDRRRRAVVDVLLRRAEVVEGEREDAARGNEDLILVVARRHVRRDVRVERERERAVARNVESNARPDRRRGGTARIGRGDAVDDRRSGLVGEAGGKIVGDLHAGRRGGDQRVLHGNRVVSRGDAAGGDRRRRRNLRRVQRAERRRRRGRGVAR